MAAPAQHVNQALGQLGTPVKGMPDGIYLLLGVVEPPIMPDEESRARVVDELKASGAKVAAIQRFHFSRQFAEEIIRVLSDSLALYDAAAAAADGEAGVAGQQEEG
jgi:hypothetical protein